MPSFAGAQTKTTLLSIEDDAGGHNGVLLITRKSGTDELQFEDELNTTPVTLTELLSSAGPHTHEEVDITDLDHYDDDDALTFLGTRTTDDLPEGVVNFYASSSALSESLADTLYYRLDTANSPQTGFFNNTFNGNASFSGASAQLAIGHLTAGQAIHVVKAVSPRIRIESTNVLGFNSPGLELADGGFIRASFIFDEANNQIDFFGPAAGAQAGIIIDGTDQIGLGGVDPLDRLHVLLGSNEIARFSNGSSDSAIWGTNLGLISESSLAKFTGTGDIALFTGGTVNTMTEGSERLRILDSNGFVGINDATPTFQLDVNGTLRVVGAATFNDAVTMDTTLDVTGVFTAGTFVVAGDFTVDSPTFFVDSTNNRVGMGTLTPQERLHLSDTDSTSVFLGERIDSIVALSDDIVVFRGFGAEDGTEVDVGSAILRAAENWTATSSPTDWIWSTVPTGQKTATEKMTLNDVGDLSVTGEGAFTGTIRALADAIVSDDFKVATSALFVDSSARKVGVGTVGPVAALDIQDFQPSSISETPGNPSDEIVTALAAAGGDTSIATTGVGGVGGGLSVTLGTGGEATAAATASTGGLGGSLSLTSGAGGVADFVGTGTNTGGAGADVTINPGAGGAASGGSVNVAGAPGNVILANLQGNVGIGTSTPDAVLDIESAAATTLRLTNTGAGAGAWELNVNAATGKWNFKDIPGGTIPLKLSMGAANNLLKLGNTVATVVDISGELGIGTESPADDLHLFDGSGNSIPAIRIENDARAWQIRVDGSSSDKFQIRDVTANEARLTINNAGFVGLGESLPATELHISSASPTIRLEATTVGQDNLIEFHDDSGLQFDMFHDTSADSFNFRGATGDVFIRTNPGFINLNPSAVDVDLLVSGVNNTNVLRVDALNGRVGIGFGTPENIFEVFDDTDSSVAALAQFRTAGTGQDSAIRMRTVTNDWTFGVRESLAQAFVFALDSTLGTGQILTLERGGDIGIGTSSPVVKLDIDAGSNLDGLRIRGTAETGEIVDLYLGATGNFVIDTTAGTDSGGFIEVRSEDNEFGLVIKESDGTGSTVLANIYVTDVAGIDFVSINMGATDENALNITAADNIGLGTSAPLEKLDVNGNSRTRGIHFQDVQTLTVNREGGTSTLTPTASIVRIILGTDNAAEILAIADGSREGQILELISPTIGIGTFGVTLGGTNLELLGSAPILTSSIPFYYIRLIWISDGSTNKWHVVDENTASAP